MIPDFEKLNRELQRYDVLEFDHYTNELRIIRASEIIGGRSTMGKKFTKEIRIGRVRILYHRGIESPYFKTRER